MCSYLGCSIGLRAYYRNYLRDEASPKQYLSLILDGMNQSKTNLPHANCLTKVKGERGSDDAKKEK